MKTAQIVIIGAGFAGASTAYHLTRSGVRDILIIEQENLAGIHSSGRNAGMIRQVVSDEAIGALAREGTDFIRLSAKWPRSVEFKQHGSLLLGSGAVWQKLIEASEKARKGGVPVQLLSPGEACRRVPVLEGGNFEGAIWCPTDGVIDIHALLQGYLELAKTVGTKVLTSEKVTGILTKQNRITSVVTHSGTIKTEIVVNAAGPWAGEIANMAAAVSAPVRPYRRHILATPVLSWVKPDWPLVWDCTEEVYFRPESGGLLLSPCDEVEYPPGIPPTDPIAAVWLHNKLKRYPGLNNLPVKRSWAGLRTLSKDGRFIIGWDPLIHGFFWVAGLGGHGVTVSGPIGRLAAELMIKQDKEGMKEFSPVRFIPQ